MESNPDIRVVINEFLELIDDEIHLVRELGSEHYEVGKSHQAEQAAGYAAKLSAFRQKVSALRNEWASMNHLGIDRCKDSDRIFQQHYSPIGRGLRARHDAFFKPILLVLKEMEGSGSGYFREVLYQVGMKMNPTLKDIDYEVLPVSSEERWRNTANYACLLMVKEGLLKKDSSRGTWELTEKGKNFLRSR